MEHEVIDDELRFAVEQIGQPHLAAGTIEDIVLDPDPRQITAMSGESIAAAREFLFLGKELDARGEPFLAGDDLVIRHRNFLRLNFAYDGCGVGGGVVFSKLSRAASRS